LRSNELVIRLAEASDSSALISLIERYWEFEQIEGFNPAHITKLLADLFHAPNRGQIWLAQEGDLRVGYLIAVYLFSLEHGGLMAEIDEFFVTPENRSRKIGSALLEAAIAQMEQRGLTHVQLQLGRNNTRGLRFYEQHGFDSLSGYRLLNKSLRP
jgi:GNAT superfamily N-acetyltransferase